MGRRLSGLPKRHGYFAVIGQGAIPFVTRDRPDLPELPETERRLIDALSEQSAWLIPSEEAREQAVATLDPKLIGTIYEELVEDLNDPDEFLE